MVIACTDMQILTNIGFSVMAALIKGFGVQSHTPDPPATLFYDKGGKPHQKINLLGSWTICSGVSPLLQLSTHITQVHIRNDKDATQLIRDMQILCWHSFNLNA